MADMLARSLQECDRLKAKAVAIGALGTGVHGFTYKMAAEIIIRAVVKYLRDNPSTSIKEVILVSPSDESYTAFLAVHNQMQQEAQHEETPIKRLHSHVINGVNLEILSGDIEQVDCDGRVLVSTAEDVERDMNSLLLPDNDPSLNRSLDPAYLFG